VEDAFGYVLLAVVLVSAVVAVLSLHGDRYGHIGRGGLFEDDPKQRLEAPASAAVVDEEARQMLGARNARRVAKGQAPLDVEAELARLKRPVADPALESEVRDLVIARNARRARRGQPPLDVESEVQKQLKDLMG
jgi:hypothetical protein